MRKATEKERAVIRRDVQPLIQRAVPPLENGDCLSQKEFHRRYEAMPDVRAELIGGIVFMQSAARVEHSEPLSLGNAFLVAYEAGTPGTRTYCEQTLILDTTDEVQPDVALGVLPSFGGSGILKDGYLIHAPELVLEIMLAIISASIDLNLKSVNVPPQQRPGVSGSSRARKSGEMVHASKHLVGVTLTLT